MVNDSVGGEGMPPPPKRVRRHRFKTFKERVNEVCRINMNHYNEVGMYMRVPTVSDVDSCMPCMTERRHKPELMLRCVFNRLISMYIKV